MLMNKRQLLTALAGGIAGQRLSAELSNSVMLATKQSLEQATKEARAHHLHAHTLRRVQTSLEIAFGNLDETGYTRHLHADRHLDDQQLLTLRQAYTSKTGAPMSEAQFQTLVQNNDVMWPKLHQLMLRGGDQAVRTTILTGLQNGADRLEKESLIAQNRGMLRLVDNIVQENTPPDVSGWDICAALGLGGVYVSTWALMDAIGAVTAFAFGPI